MAISDTAYVSADTLGMCHLSVEVDSVVTQTSHSNIILVVIHITSITHITMGMQMHVYLYLLNYCNKHAPQSINRHLIFPK